MSRWTYLIPRIFILGLIALAVWVGAQPLLRRVAISHLENATGAKVEVSQLRCSLKNQKIVIRDMTVADPSSPMNNLLQADLAYLELNSNALWQRRIVVEDGRTSRLVFGSPRTYSGQLDTRPVPEKQDFQPIVSPPKSVATIGQRWLDQLVPAESNLVSEADLQLYQVGNQVNSFWTTELAQFNQQLNQLNATTQKYSQVINQDDGNPLRVRNWKSNSFYELQDVAVDSKGLLNRWNQLQGQLAKHITALETARRADSASIQTGIVTTNFNSKDMSELLLGKMNAEYTDEIVNLFRWFRHALPNPETDFAPKTFRGQDIALKGVKQLPRFLIKKLELNGEGRFLNQHFDFAGNAFDITTQPKWHDQPTRFELRAQGDQHVIVNCIIDRRQDETIEQLKIICPDLEIDQQLLGDAKSLQVTLGPKGLVQAEINLVAKGNEISGDIILSHSNASFHVDKLNDLAGGKTTALELNQGLALIQDFRSHIKVSGTLDNFTHTSTSTLGAKFSAAANQVLKTKTASSISKRQEYLQDMKSAQLKKMAEIEKQLNRLRKKLQENEATIANLTQAFDPKKSGLRQFK